MEPRTFPDEGLGYTYDCALALACEQLEALPAVKPPARYDKAPRRVLVNVWCRGSHKSALKQPFMNLNKKGLADPTAVRNVCPTPAPLRCPDSGQVERATGSR